MTYSIADYIFETIGSQKEIDFVGNLAGMSKFEFSGKSQGHIVFTENIDLPPNSSLVMHITDSMLKIVKSEIETTLYTFPNGCFLRVTRDGNEVELIYYYNSDRVTISNCRCPVLMRFVLWAAYALLTYRDGISPIHSSSIVYKEEAILFLGESGTGKSTQSKLWCKNIDGCKLLNDDGPIVRIIDNKLFVYGSPWSGKTPRYIPRKFPVKAFVRLKRTGECNVEKLKSINAFSQIYPSMPTFMASDEVLREYIIDSASRISALSDVYLLSALPNAECAKFFKCFLYGAEHDNN